MGAQIDIFEGLRKCSAEEQATLAALLEQGHLGRAVGPEVVKFANKVIGLLSKQAELDHVSFEALLEQSKQRFLALTPDERIVFIRDNVVDRMGYTGPKNGPAITLAALRAVAQKHGVDSFQLPCALAGQVMTSKMKQMSEEFRRQWEAATPAQKAQFDRELERRLAVMSPEKQRELRKMLGVDRLNAQTVRGVLFSLGSTIGLSSVVNVAGFGAYIALSVVVHFIFTTILGITLPFAVYAFLSSTLAFFANPLVAIPLGAGTTTYKWITQGRKMNTELIDMVVFTGAAQQVSALSVLSKDRRWCSSDADRENFESNSRHIQSLVGARDQKQADIEAAVNVIRNAREEVVSLRNALTSAKANADAARAKRMSLEEELTALSARSVSDSQEAQEGTAEERSSLEALLAAAREEEARADEAQRNAEQKAQTIPVAEVKATSAEKRLQLLEAELQRTQASLDAIYKKRSEQIAAHLAPRTPYLNYNEQVFAALARLENLEDIQQAEGVLIELNEGVYQQVGGPGTWFGYDYAWFGSGSRLYFSRDRAMNIVHLGHHATESLDYVHLRTAQP